MRVLGVGHTRAAHALLDRAERVDLVSVCRRSDFRVQNQRGDRGTSAGKGRAQEPRCPSSGADSCFHRLGVVSFQFVSALGEKIMAAGRGNLSVLGEDIQYNHESYGPTTLYRLREGVERFLVTDINNPGADNVAESQLACCFDTVAPDTERFNHVPGGGNAFYLDGQVGFQKYPAHDTYTRARMSVISTLHL
jgi:hypothetical protein